jgi:hypothetical protein
LEGEFSLDVFFKSWAPVFHGTSAEDALEASGGTVSTSDVRRFGDDFLSISAPLFQAGATLTDSPDFG